MLLLLKQARAFGVGVILSTQNPVDLDYKGLSNIGTWFIGRLQTRQDIDRVIDGLGGKTDSSFNKKEISTLLANLNKRTFFLKSAHLDDIRLFSTRWVLSYLKGPLQRNEIALLMADRKSAMDESVSQRPKKAKAKKDDGFDSYSTLDKRIPQLFKPDFSGQTNYSPTLLAHLQLHYFNQTRGIDIEESMCLSLPLGVNENDLDWEQADKEEETRNCFDNLPLKPPSDIRYAPVPEFISGDKKLAKATRELKDWAYHTHKLDLFRIKSPKMESRPHETLGDFKVRINDALNDQKEEEIDTLKERYAKKEKVLMDRLEREMERLDKEKSDTTGSFMNAGITVLGALFGKSRASIGRAGTRIFKERGDVGRAEERVKKVEDDIHDLETELEEKINELADKYNIDTVEIEEFAIKLRKSDIVVDTIAVVWSTE
jgi:hypothetical protein